MRSRAKRLVNDTMKNDSIYFTVVRKLLVDTLMGVIFLLLFSFALWLIWLTFFREYFDDGILGEATGEYFTSQTNVTMSSMQRFHNVVEQVPDNSEFVTSCMLCHEDLPHSKSKDTRAFLNAHGYFMTCQVCHAKHDDKMVVGYRWQDKETGHISDTPHMKGMSRITPVVVMGGLVQTIDIKDEKNFVLEYLKTNNAMDMKKEDTVWKKTHGNISTDPISCVDCHTIEKQPFLPLSELAYSASRIEELSRIEVAGMIKKYEHLYLPNLTRDSE